MYAKDYCFPSLFLTNSIASFPLICSISNSNRHSAEKSLLITVWRFSALSSHFSEHLRPPRISSARSLFRTKKVPLPHPFNGLRNDARYYPAVIVYFWLIIVWLLMEVKGRNLRKYIFICFKFSIWNYSWRNNHLIIQLRLYVRNFLYNYYTCILYFKQLLSLEA